MRAVEVKNNIKEWSLWDYEGYDLSKEEAEVIVKALEQEPKWIPVSERLPKKNVWVLVTVEQSGNCHQEIMRRDNYVEAWTDNLDNYTNEITAWMPLPEPYKANEEVMEND